jgi:hypothetical protein
LVSSKKDIKGQLNKNLACCTLTDLPNDAEDSGFTEYSDISGELEDIDI